MDFKQIEAFVNVIKYKSFSKAADALFLTQPTISTHINTLEKELNMQLIDRQNKEALPTQQGKIFFKYALNMLNTREKAIFSLQNYKSNITGILEIQTSSIPGEYLVPGLLARFKRQYPKVRFYLEQSDSQTAAKNILENKGEIGLIGTKIEYGLANIPILKDEIVLITPNNEKFRALVGKNLNFRDVANESFIIREQGSGTRKEFEEKIEALGCNLKDIHVIARMNSMEAIKQSVACGLGVSFVSKIAAGKPLDGENYLTFSIGDFRSDRLFYLVYNKKVTLSPIGETFKAFVLDYFRINEE